MRAWVIREAGGPAQFSLDYVPTPEPRDGWALIHVRAFGLNRSEWFTRNGDSPDVRFPRVLGIECVGSARPIPNHCTRKTITLPHSNQRRRTQ